MAPYVLHCWSYGQGRWQVKLQKDAKRVTIINAQWLILLILLLLSRTAPRLAHLLAEHRTHGLMLGLRSPLPYAHL